MPDRIPIHIPAGTRVLRIERIPESYPQLAGIMSHFKPGHYRIWLHTSDFVLGTYLRLWDNGRMERVTVYDDHQDAFEIKPEDK